MATVTRTMAVCVFLLLQSGCATFGGDLIVRVSGHLPAAHAADDGRPCELTILDASDVAIASKPVSGRFSVPMMVVAGPEPKQYHFTVQCPDGTTFESKSVQISSRRSDARDIDLGQLQSL